ncbi:hypothetical protein C8R42DRAFT_644436 [Lentinula raphanica]|nr:hypothetical protein C8R42DRAFT_644436 [Lentinula raphanica]
MAVSEFQSGSDSKTSTIPEEDRSTSTLGVMERFDKILADYENFRQVWKQEAVADVLTTVHSTERIEKTVSANLVRFCALPSYLPFSNSLTQNKIQQMLEDFRTDIAVDFEEHVRSRRAEVTSVLTRTGMQMEILRLLEMRLLLPDHLWQAENDILQEVHTICLLGEILSRSQSDFTTDDYVALQKASLRILERLFRSLLPDPVDSVY